MTIFDTCGPTQTPDDIDIDALREKYLYERDKRLRPEGSKQYLELKDDFAEFAEVDPHTPVAPRAPIDENIDVAVLGGGITGLLAGAYLKKAGVEDVHIIEMAGDFGGVWYWNRFPGIQCDNDAYCYIPMLEELNYIPSKKFADGAEIYEHCRRIAKHFGLYDGAIFSTQVRVVRWDETIKRWRLSTNRGDDIRARFVVMAQGSFNRPKLPGIPGLKDFTGHMFHSARWDYDYTGAEDPAALTIEQIMTIREEEDYKVMERLRRRVAELVDDPETAEALKPYYRFMCKRPCSNDEYLPTFNCPNVTLVDVSESKGVERLTEKGIVADGVEYEVDCVIFASGFEITTDISRRYAVDVIEGRDGLSLFDHWRDSYKSLHGMTSRGFPNQFFTGFIQGGVAGNTTAMLEQQAEHIAYIISEAMARRATTVEPSQEAQDNWVKTIRETSIDASEFAVSCTPGYYNNEGGGGGEGIRSAIGEPYMPGFYVFGDLLKEWRAKGDLDGLVLENTDG